MTQYVENSSEAIGAVKRPPSSVTSVSNSATDRRRFLIGSAAATAALGVTAGFPSAALAASAPKSTVTHNTAPNLFVEVDGVRYAYRRFGKVGGAPPILLFHHYIGTMDWWDPALTDRLAASREVILFDNRGVGLSSGQTPNRISAMAEDAHAFIHGLSLNQVDLLAFSIGGMVGQELALRHPDDIRKLLLVGTGPRGGSGMADPKPNVVKALTDAAPDFRNARPYLFFSQTENGRAAAAAFSARTAERKIDLDPRSSMQTMQAHNEALGEFGATAQHAEYMTRLAGLKQPTLVVNGNNDIMVDTINSYQMSRVIPRAQLIIYPDSGHGSLFQYAPLFVKHVDLFLDRSDF
jgi:pimeloyl-ACP methyl ester carboxylesterase